MNPLYMNQEEITETLNYISSLSKGWAGYGTTIPDPETIDKTRELIKTTTKQIVDVCLSFHGTIYIHLDPDIHLEIGTNNYSYYAEDGKIMVDGQGDPINDPFLL